MNASFATTRWTLVLAAKTPPTGSEQTDTSAHRALSELCRVYWNPLYAHARRHDLSPADAEDAVQGFFARLLRLDSIASARREHGRFRSFLLASFDHYLADLRDHNHAQKRDARLRISLDTTTAEIALAANTAPTLSPDQAFDRAWALTLLNTVVARLRDEHAAQNRLPLFEALAHTLSTTPTGQQGTPSFADIATRLGLTETAARVTAHRLRQRYRQLLRDEIAHTLARPEDIDDELRHLLAALRS
ncbi:sigma-70 family RNA polymerase sigma factor [Opitutaceae bacterium TAV4]|nr:sigma-70 family RNA polymerase sigma factor [Opitutaceae bacterium TAV4]RRK01756.1 sigma-70 family RNA polymerase sigma factor [Opitutaceae bacterium TAV3]